MLAKVRINSLLDCYESLLTKKQQEICTYYYREDLSLQEIAEIEEISRSAVYDSIRHCKSDLEHYESLLGMLENSTARSALYEKMLQKTDDPGLKKLVHQCIKTEIGGQHE
jgi:predicted DNA-binding protein YlxM (UPF0122 family)